MIESVNVYMFYCILVARALCFVVGDMRSGELFVAHACFFVGI
jgi:hypothetical protein